VSAPAPLLSIIIVAYQSRAEIGPCLASLPRALNGRPVETVVVDNSSNADGTGDRVRQDFPWVNYVDPAANIGFGRANNLGFARTAGEYVLFLNPDTVVNEPALAHCLARLAADPGIGLISPQLVQADGAMDLACRRSIPGVWDGFCRASGLATRFPQRALFAGYNLTHLPATGTYEVGAINGAFMLGRRSLLATVAEPSAPAVFDERFFMYGDDLDLCIRVARAGHRIVYDGAVRVTHLKGVSVAKDFDRMAGAIFTANRDVYLKHFGASAWSRLKWRTLFGLWRWVASLRAKARGHRAVRPV
jgi:N-acetylglucosaminyl-diphospho-decaprenol L-rhamnosyltransferase